MTAGGTLVASTVDQTIFASDPDRLGNCVAACVATFLGLELHQVPHFLEHGQTMWEAAVGHLETDDNPAGPDRCASWAMLIGFMAAHGLAHVILDGVDDAQPGELVFAGGPSVRGVMHQVLYRDGQLWHDPHPSRAGLLEITEVEAWRPVEHDHAPTVAHPVRPAVTS